MARPDRKATLHARVMQPCLADPPCPAINSGLEKIGMPDAALLAPSLYCRPEAVVGMLSLPGVTGLRIMPARACGHAPGALEHHVLQHVRNAGGAGALIHAAGLVPDLLYDYRRAVVLLDDYLEAIAQCFLKYLGMCCRSQQ